MYPVSEFVGCQLHHNEDVIVLHQQKKIDKLQVKYDEELSHLRHYMTPMAINTHVKVPKNVESPLDEVMQ